MDKAFASESVSLGLILQATPKTLQMILAAFLHGAQYERGGVKKQADTFGCCVVAKNDKPNTSVFMWRTGGETKQFIGSSGQVKTMTYKQSMSSYGCVNK